MSEIFLFINDFFKFINNKKKGKEGNFGLLLFKSLCIKEEIVDEKEDMWRFRVYEVEWDVVVLLILF